MRNISSSYQCIRKIECHLNWCDNHSSHFWPRCHPVLQVFPQCGHLTVFSEQIHQQIRT